jgi:hypothetical protein
VDTYECGTDADCQCQAGFYGNGQTCTPCTKCSPFATATIDPNVTASGVGCPIQGALLDGVSCKCNAGYYGDGITCTPCKVCDSRATTFGKCDPGSTTDMVSCCCIAGHSGNGVGCTPCAAGTYASSACGLFRRFAAECLLPFRSLCFAELTDLKEILHVPFF